VSKPENNLLLAVDDERDFLDLIAELAEDVGYEVVATDNPDAFRQAMGNHRPSLVLLDLQIPGMDGVEALRALAKQGTQAGVILMSGLDQRVLTSAKQLGESLGLKMLATLQKPLMIEDIEAVLTRHLGAPTHLTSDDLRRAVEEGELCVHYQPMLSHESRGWRVTGAEALVRWQHPRYGLLYPMEFLHLADDHHITTAIADFVLIDAIRQIGHWRSRGLDLCVAVNLAQRLVKDLEFPDRLGCILQEYNVPGSQLTLEVREDAADHDSELVMDIYTRLRVKGVGLALDDFGVGPSSFTHLYKMPFSILKIDRELIKQVPADRSTSVAVRAVVQLAHALSLRVSAEGVETSLAFDFVNEIGCDHVQGDFFAKAMPASELETFIASWHNDNKLKSAVGG